MRFVFQLAKIVLHVLLKIIGNHMESNEFRKNPLYHALIKTLIIYPPILSVLILLNSQSVIRCSSYHTVVFWIHITPLWNWWHSTQCFSQYTMHEVLWRHSYHRVQNLYQVGILYSFEMKPTNSTPKHKCIRMIFNSRSRSEFIVHIEKLRIFLLKMFFFCK